MISIRRATIDDCNKIQLLNNELFDLELSESDKYLIKDWPLSDEGKKYFLDAINHDYVIVAEMDGNIVGYLLGSISDYPYYNFQIAELCNMCISNKHKRQGVGKMLMNTFKDYYRSMGISKFIVTASYLNNSAVEFYKSQGFRYQNITLCDFDE